MNTNFHEEGSFWVSNTDSAVRVSLEYTNVVVDKSALEHHGLELREGKSFVSIYAPASEINKYEREMCIIYKPYGIDRHSVRKAAEINWSAWGSQSTEATRRFAEALLFASAIAEAINAVGIDLGGCDETKYPDWKMSDIIVVVG